MRKKRVFGSETVFSNHLQCCSYSIVFVLNEQERTRGSLEREKTRSQSCFVFCAWRMVMRLFLFYFIKAPGSSQRISTYLFLGFVLSQYDSKSFFRMLLFSSKVNSVIAVFAISRICSLSSSIE